MQLASTPQISRHVLIVDSGLNGNGHATAATRSVRALATELHGRGMEVIESMSCEDGMATAQLRRQHRLHPASTGPRATTTSRSTPRPPSSCARFAVASAPADLPDGRPHDRRHGHRRGRAAGRRVHLDSAGHPGLHRRSRHPPRVDRYLEQPAAAVRRARWSTTTATPSIPGRRPDTRAASPSASRRSAACSSTAYGETLFRTDMGIERGSARAPCCRTAARSARARAMSRGCSARTAATRC